PITGPEQESAAQAEIPLRHAAIPDAHPPVCGPAPGADSALAVARACRPGGRLVPCAGSLSADSAPLALARRVPARGRRAAPDRVPPPVAAGGAADRADARARAGARERGLGASGPAGGREGEGRGGEAAARRARPGREA